MPRGKCRRRLADTGKGVKMTSANFFPHESRCCSNPGVHKLYPFSNITRPVRESCNFAPRVRVERNVTIEAENFSGQTYIFKYFPLTLLRFLISSIIMNTRFSLYQQRWWVRAPARPFSQVQKNPWELFLSCAVRCVNQERPKVIFRHDDRISCISPLLFFPLVLLFISRRKFSPPFPSLFRSFSLIKFVYGHREHHIEAAGS